MALNPIVYTEKVVRSFLEGWEGWGQFSHCNIPTFLRLTRGIEWVQRKVDIQGE